MCAREGEKERKREREMGANELLRAERDNHSSSITHLNPRMGKYSEAPMPIVSRDYFSN